MINQTHKRKKRNIQIN